MTHTLEDLLEALEDVDDATREEAAKALAELGDPKTLDALVGACGSGWLLRFWSTLADHSERLRKLRLLKSGERLEALLHPLIRSEVTSRIANCNGKSAVEVPYIVLVVPLLVETSAYRELARRVLVVDCDEELQVARVMRRSGLTPDAVRAIMANQVSRARRLAHADDVVRNDGDLAALESAVAALHERYMRLRTDG